jgi:hypothetical protein
MQGEQQLKTIHYADALNELAEDVSNISEDKGFWNFAEVGENAMIPMKIALIHTELSEALEVHRKEYDDDDCSELTGMTPMQEDDFSEEMADAVIRILDVIGGYGLNDFGEILIAKIEKNRDRPHLHGKKRY